MTERLGSIMTNPENGNPQGIREIVRRSKNSGAYLTQASLLHAQDILSGSDPGKIGQEDQAHARRTLDIYNLLDANKKSGIADGTKEVLIDIVGNQVIRDISR